MMNLEVYIDEDLDKTEGLKTEVIDIHKVKGKRPEYDLYIGRKLPPFMDPDNLFTKNSKWHNPYKPKEVGIIKSLDLFDSYIRQKIEKNPKKYDIDELIGKRLGCWCRSRYEFCHGQVLLDLLYEKYPNSYYLNDWVLIVQK